MVRSRDTLAWASRASPLITRVVASARPPWMSSRPVMVSTILETAMALGSVVAATSLRPAPMAEPARGR